MPDFPGAVPDIPDANIAETLYTMHGSLGHVQGTNRILANLRALATKLGLQNGTGPGGSGAVLRRTATGESGWGPLVNADVDAAAAITYGKLNLANGIVAADLTSQSVIGPKLGAGVPAVLQAGNAIYNGHFTVAQRPLPGTIGANSSGPWIDGWSIANSTATGTYTTNRSTDVPAASALVGHSATSGIITVGTAVATFGAAELAYALTKVEGYDFQRLYPRTMMLSFDVKSSLAGTYCVTFRNAAINRYYVAEYQVNVANAWEHKDIVVPAASTAGGTWDTSNGAGVMVFFILGSGANYRGATAGAWGTDANTMYCTANQVNFAASSGRTFQLHAVQLIPSPDYVPLPAPDYDKALLKCQRYWEPNGWVQWGYAVNSGQVDVAGRFAVSKRAVPTMAIMNAAAGSLHFQTAAGTYTTTGAQSLQTFGALQDGFFVRLSGFSTLATGAVGFITENMVSASAEM